MELQIYYSFDNNSIIKLPRYWPKIILRVKYHINLRTSCNLFFAPSLSVEDKTTLTLYLVEDHQSFSKQIDQITMRSTRSRDFHL